MLILVHMKVSMVRHQLKLGIEITGDNKWKTFIENASKK